MKKEETVEVQYIKRSTGIAAALICLALGFAAGWIFSNLESSGPEVRKMTVQEPAMPQAGNVQTQEKLDLVMALQARTADNPEDADAWARLGNAYFDMNKFEEAIGAYKKHLELKPENADVWTDLGIMYRRSRKPNEALQAFDKAIALDPKHQQSRFNKGVVFLHDLQSPQEALKAWEELLKINPDARTPSGQSVKSMVEKLRQ